MFLWGQWKDSLQYLNPPLIFACAIDAAVAVLHVHMVCFLLGGNAYRVDGDEEDVETGLQQQQQQQQENIPMTEQGFGQPSH